MSADHTMKPGYLVSLKTTITGGIEYERVDIEHEEDGTIKYDKWETTKTIRNVKEYEKAVALRASIIGKIRRPCIRTPFGLVCLVDREDELTKAIEESRRLVQNYNSTATESFIAVHVLKGAIAGTDKDAVEAIRSEMASMLKQMEGGIAKADAAYIRDAAKRARQMAAMLPDKDAKAIDEAVQVARDAARVITARIDKIGEEAEVVLREINASPISKARFAFLDFDGKDEDSDSKPAKCVDKNRFAGIDA